MAQQAKFSFGSVIVFVIVVFVFSKVVCTGSKDPSVVENEHKEEMRIHVIVTVHDFVKQRLKAPSTADFPYGELVTDKGNGIYFMNSYVDAQNGFGAMLRNYYTCELQFNGRDWIDENNWNIINIKITE